MIPNKTAPCLIKELLDFDPRVDADDSILHKGHQCQHEYKVVDRSNLPDSGQLPDKETAWALYAVCEHCRCHLEIKVAFPDSTTACPTELSPVHHLLHKPGVVGHGGTSTNVSHFECSTPECRARVAIRVESPVLSQRDVEVLVNQQFLKRRYNYSVAYRGPGEEITVFKALSTFRSYVTNAIGGIERRRIPVANKFFMLALGNDADQLLTKLGFEYLTTPSSTEAFWVTPTTTGSDASAPGHVPMSVLQDVVDEVNALMCQRPQEERVPGRFSPMPGAAQHMSRILGYLDYEKTKRFDIGDNSTHIRACYNELGALEDFSDRLIEFAYDRQAANDPTRAPSYFQALKEIASSRQSELLQIKASTLESQGQISQQSINSAYRLFGIDPRHAHLINDQHIKGLYQSRIADSSAEARAEAKNALRALGHIRNSQILLQGPMASIITYEDALNLLGAGASTPDDFITTLAAAKVGEEDHSSVERAVKIISEHRQNPGILYSFGGSVEADDMDLPTAYSTIGCNENDNEQELVDSTSIVFADGTMQQKQRIRQAFRVIARSKNSQRLMSYLEEHLTVSNIQPRVVDPSEPRGLDNIGQTCYLNSLLQYFFTFKQVRNLVLDYPLNRSDLDPEKPFPRKVGRENLRASDIRRSHHFVEELQTLFKQLINTKETSIKPRDELAGLTLDVERTVDSPETRPTLSTTTTRRRSTLTGSSRLAGVAVNLPDPQAEMLSSQQQDNKDPASSPVKSTSVPSALMDGMKTEEINTSSSAPDSIGHKSDESVGQATPSTSSADNAMDTDETSLLGAGSTSQVTENMITEDVASSVQSNVLQQQPQPRTIDKSELANIAQQHDVHEVMDNVIDHLRRAFAPEGKDEDGEQVDTISRLFFGRCDEGQVVQGKRQRKIEDFSALILVPRQKRNNIYEAFKSYNWDPDFTADKFNYCAVQKLPPILQFFVQRVDFEKATGKTIKIDNVLDLRKVIYADRFLADDEMFARMREVRTIETQLEDIDRQLREVTQTELDMNVPEMLRTTAEYLESQQLRDCFSDEVQEVAIASNREEVETLLQLADLTTEEMTRKRDLQQALQTSLSNAFDDESGHHAYHLHAVFFHRGDSHSGHWFIYLYDAQNDTWRQYNDETVTIVSNVNEFLQPDEHGRETSAFISYVQADRATELIETVKRNPVMACVTEEMNAD